MTNADEPITPANALQKVMESGLINPEAKLKDMVNLSQHLATLPGKSAANPDDIYCFIHSNFVAIHRD